MKIHIILILLFLSANICFSESTGTVKSEPTPENPYILKLYDLKTESYGIQISSISLMLTQEFDITVKKRVKKRLKELKMLKKYLPQGRRYSTFQDD